MSKEAKIKKYLLCSIEMCYNVDDLLPICEELNLPLVVSSSAFGV